VNELAQRSNSTVKCFIIAIKKMLGKEEEKGKKLSSFKFLFFFPQKEAFQRWS
jgi:hypothetical protein